MSLSRSKPMKHRQIRKDWSDAQVKRGPCRVCGTPIWIELAHTVGKAYQDELVIGPRGGKYLWVNPDSVIPLCGSLIGRGGCHYKYDQRQISILGLLTFAELRNVIAAVGKERARRRLSGGLN